MEQTEAVRTETAAEAGRRRFPGKRVYGLTGGVGSGKSMVLNLLRERYGAFVLEADKVAKELMEPGGAAFERIVALMGPGILLPEGHIDRDEMSRRMFRDPELVLKVNAIVHPETCRVSMKAIEEAQEALVIYEAALPREANFRDFCDAVIYVWASRETRIRRLIQGRGYSPEKCESIMNSQLSDGEFRSLADVTLNNDGSPEETEAALETLMRELGQRSACHES